MGVVKETLDLLGLAVLFDFLKDSIARIKNFFIPPKAYSWQTLIYLSVFSWLMSSLAGGKSPVQAIIAFCGWIFLIAGTSWYTTDNPLYIPGTVMPVGAVITGALVSIFAFRELDISRTIVFWPTISAIITVIPEFFEGSGTDVKTQLPKLEDRQSGIVLVACCMLLSCWINIYIVTDNWLQEYPSAKYPIDPNQASPRNSLLMVFEPENKIPENGVIILSELEKAVQTTLDGKSWSNVELWLKNANRNARELGRKVINIKLEDLEEKEYWQVEANVENIVPDDINSGYRLNLFSV